MITKRTLLKKYKLGLLAEPKGGGAIGGLSAQTP